MLPTRTGISLPPSSWLNQGHPGCLGGAPGDEINKLSWVGSAG